MVRLTFETGRLRELDILPSDAYKITVAAAMLTKEQLARAFTFAKLRTIAVDLRLQLPKTKAAAIAAIVGYFA